MRSPFRRARAWLADLLNRRRDIDALYKILYDEVHNLDEAREFSESSTAEAFGRQWSELPEGEYLLSDPWFRENVDRILCEQEVLLRPEWFAGKRVLDAGCGNGRWSYGFSKLGAALTSVDINASALSLTKDATAQFDNPRRLVQTPLERLNEHVAARFFDLVFCWGVSHHCVQFIRVLDNLTQAVADGGVLYLYLYGRDTVTPREDLRTFRDRVAYNVLMDDEERMRFLLHKARGNKDVLHSMHDIYAPLINRRFTYEQIAELLAERGFTDCARTIEHAELFVRATRGDVDLAPWSLPPKPAPYWFEGKHL